MNQKAGRQSNPLGFEPITKMLLKYAIPSVVSMLVMSLYNIVDQIFIGWSVGYLGNTATTVAFPLTTVGLAIGLLIGNGGSAFISLELGRSRTDQAKRTLGNAVTLLIVSSVLFAALVLAFLRPVLRLLGATDAIMPYAADYTWIIMTGMPFNMFALAVSNMIRADGSPRYSMMATLSGALLNVALDPVFIFVFGMGVKGAAIATVISQVVSAAICLFYVLRLAKFVKLRAKYLRLKTEVIARICALGSSNFITQGAMTILNIVLNNTLKHYGALSPYGSEIPLAALGIVMKINGILISVILGVMIGAQPLLGYNYGAGNFDRVKQTYKKVISITFTLSASCNLLFVLIPGVFVAAFGDSSPQFNEFASMAMRIFLGCVFAAGIQIPSSGYFQAVGKPLLSMTLALTRQMLFLVPLIILLPRFFGVKGVLYAGPAGDLLALAVTAVFIIREMRQLDLRISAGGQALAQG